MKNTWQMFRELPNYPIIVTRAIALYHAILGSFVLLSGIALLTYNQEIGQGLAAMGFASGMDVTLSTTSTLITIFGGLSALFGFLGLWVALGIVLRRPPIWRQTIVLNLLYIANFLMGIKNVASIILVALAVATVLIFLFDNRVKAVFKRGPLAQAEPAAQPPG